jgi:hypothetical protein
MRGKEELGVAADRYGISFWGWWRCSRISVDSHVILWIYRNHFRMAKVVNLITYAMRAFKNCDEIYRMLTIWVILVVTKHMHIVTQPLPPSQSFSYCWRKLCLLNKFPSPTPAPATLSPTFRLSTPDYSRASQVKSCSICPFVSYFT